jgi:hypothetical protein
VADSLGIAKDLFLGTYFAGDDEATMRQDISRLLAMSGKKQLDLAHSYPDSENGSTRD